LRWDCRLERLSLKDDPVDGRVVDGTRDSFSMVTRRPKVDGVSSSEVN
jgi:hypothetical protein